MQGYLNGDNIGTVTWSLHNIDIIPNMSCISILREIFVKKKRAILDQGSFPMNCGLNGMKMRHLQENIWIKIVVRRLNKLWKTF